MSCLSATATVWFFAWGVGNHRQLWHPNDAVLSLPAIPFAELAVNWEQTD